MNEGKWRVTTGVDGTRYLYLFKEDGDYVSMSLDPTADDDGFAILFKKGENTDAVIWSTDAFESVLDCLSKPAPSTSEEKK